MRFMMMHKNDANTEAGLPPPVELVQKMGAFVGGHAQAGRLIDGAGLAGSGSRTRLTFKGGEATVRNGPYKGQHELPAAWLLLKVKTRDEALRWAMRYGRVLGDGELELGKVNEPWDIGLMPVPENAPLQVLLIEKADQDSEGAGRTPQQKSAISKLKTEMTAAGVLVRSMRLTPSADGKRLTFNGNRMRAVDGPFAESKELIGGFAVLELKDIDEAVEVAKPYVEILGGNAEIDIRGVAGEA
jgi:hypothetical protein